jgi:hypothetical protein
MHALTTLACLTAPIEKEVIQMTPLWEEDRHFIHYRCLVINAMLDNIESMIDEIDLPNKYQILDSVNIIRINMGVPKLLCNPQITNP